MSSGTPRRTHRAARFQAATGALPALALVLGIAVAAPRATAAPLVASAGWVHADVGLDQAGDGLALGLGTRLPLGDKPWDLVCALEYVQKRGTQPTWFTAPANPAIRDDATVTLHVLQPVALLELRALPTAWPRPYAGLSLALKVSEHWSDFPGVPSTDWGYEDTDFVGHLGLTREVGPVRLDVRYSHGLTDQLLIDPDTGNPAKAVDPLPGVETPEVGAHVTLWQIGAAWAF